MEAATEYLLNSFTRAFKGGTVGIGELIALKVEDISVILVLKMQVSVEHILKCKEIL